MRRDPIELGVRDAQRPVGFGQVAPVVAFGSAQGLGNEESLVPLEPPQVHPGEHRGELRIGQDAAIEFLHQHLDGAFSPQLGIEGLLRGCVGFHGAIQ